MRCGVFLPTTNNGYIFSTASPQFLPSYALNRQVCVTAEEVGFAFALSMVKHRGYGDGAGFMDFSVESTAVIGPLIEATTTLELWASIGAPSLNPAMAARLAATLDDASGGRFALNVVAGWNRAEYAQMGVWPGEAYDAGRYDYTQEYIWIMRQLWEHGRLTHHSRFFDLDDCLVQPRPPHGVPVIVPGHSPASLALCAAVADNNFILGDLPQLKHARDGLLAACEQTGRSVKSTALFGVITAPTDAEAAALAEDYMRNVDVIAQRGLKGAASKDRAGATMKMFVNRDPADVKVEFEHPERATLITGECFFCPHLVGSYDRIAAYLDAVETECGVDGAVLSVPDYERDIRTVGEEVLSRMTTLERAGAVA